MNDDPYFDSAEERDAHMKMWKGLNHQERLDWVFRQLMICPITGDWISRIRPKEEEE
jgi:hypothetical protein